MRTHTVTPSLYIHREGSAHSPLGEYIYCERTALSRLSQQVAFAMDAPSRRIFLYSKYHRKKFLAKGSSGSVFRATDIRTNNPVVIKYGFVYVLFEPWDEDVCGELMSSEAKVLPHMASVTPAIPGLPQLVDYGQFKWHGRDVSYLAVKDTGSVDLNEYTAACKLPENAAFDIFEKVFETVYRCAKEANVFHGDLKPANIVINPQTKEVTVIDWGSVHVSPDARIKYRTCTTDYSSPEALAIEHGGTGYNPEKLLVWSLGAILYELLTKCLFLQCDAWGDFLASGCHFNHCGPMDVNKIEALQSKLTTRCLCATSNEYACTIMLTATRLNPAERGSLEDIRRLLKNVRES